MHTPQRISVLLLSLAAGLASAAAATPEYRVTVVGPANSTAADINQAGVVVGSYPYGRGKTHGFLNRGRGLVDLHTPGGSSSTADAINDRGQVLGNWTTAGGQWRGFLYYQGRRADIGAVPGYTTTYTDINNTGYITAIGGARGSPDRIRSFLRTPCGSYTDIGNLPFEEPTMNNALALNNRNQIAGESGEFIYPDQPLRAIVWSRGVMRDLGDFGYAPNGAVAINDRGQLTGYMSIPTGLHSRVAFLYSHGRLVDIDGRPSSILDRYSAGSGINNHGHVVGSSDHLSGFIYRGRRMESLNALIDPAPRWDIVAPRAINDAGQIAATAYRGGVSYAVRLDLIRPHALGTPRLDSDDEAGSDPPSSPPEAACGVRMR